MSSRKHYPTFGTPGAVFPYPQSENKVPGFFVQAMQDIGSQKTETVFSLYCATHELMTHKRAQPKNALDMVLTQSPADFLLHHEAHGLSGANDSGFESGLLLHSFLAEVRASKGAKYVLIVNPTILFAQALRYASIPASYHLTCLFDEQTARIYQMDGTLRSFKASTLKTFNREKPYHNILIFHLNSSVAELETLLSDLFPSGLPGHCKLHVAMPATILSGQSAKPLRELLANNFPLRHILVVDPKATHIAPSKRCILTFYEKGDELSVQRAQLSRNQSLFTGPNYIMSRDVFVTSGKPLHQLCAELEQRSVNTGEREHAVKLSLSRHIVLRYRTEQQRKDKSRVIAYYTSVGTPSQQRRNLSGRGRRISKFYRSGSMSSPQEIESYLWNLLWDNELAEVIRKDICDNVDPELLDLPTLWYMRQPELQKNDMYHHKSCVNFFCSLSPTDSFYSLKLNSSTEVVCTALADYAQKHCLSGNQKRELIIQLRLIWNQACIKKYCSSNPFNDILANHERKKHERSSLTEASTLRAIEQDCMARLEAFLKERNDLALNALISLKWHTGLPSSEIGALNWNDLDHVTNMDFKVLMVSKRLLASSTTPVSFGTLEQNRVLPLPQIAIAIHKYRRAERKLARADGITDTDFNKLPMFHAPNDRTRRLSKNGINKIIKPARDALGIEHQYVPLPNGEEVESHDVNHFGGDIFRAFYDVRVREAAPFRDDSAYLYCTAIHSVACQHYRDFWHPATQLMLHQVQNRCANLQCTSAELDTTQHPFCINPARDRSFIVRTSSVRTQTTVTIPVPTYADIGDLSIQLQCRFGMDLTISYRPNS